MPYARRGSGMPGSSETHEREREEGETTSYTHARQRRREASSGEREALQHFMVFLINIRF